MGNKTKVQSIKRKDSEQLYITIPMQAARMLDLTAGDPVEWSIVDRTTLVLKRLAAPVAPLEKKLTKR